MPLTKPHILFYSKHGRLPKSIPHLSFKEDDNETNRMLAVFHLPPEEIIEYYKKRAKNKISTGAWDELRQSAHSRAFTVAQSMYADVLQDIYDVIERQKEDGLTVKDCTEMLKPVLKEKNWWGKKVVDVPGTDSKKVIQLGSPNRIRTIVETNSATAAARGRWASMQRIKHLKPYVIYKQKDKKTKRPEHAKFHNKIFHLDDPVLKRIIPPSEFGCKCSIYQLSKKQAENHATGEIIKGSDLDMSGFEQQIDPLTEWKPDTKKYHKGIAKDLEKVLA